MSFVCDKCNGSFKRRYHLVRHLKTPCFKETLQSNKIKIPIQLKNNIIPNCENIQSIVEKALNDERDKFKQQFDEREKILTQQFDERAKILTQQFDERAKLLNRENIPPVVNVNISNITKVNNVINLSFNDHITDIFEEMAKLHGFQKATQILHNAIKDKTKHNKFNSIVNLFDPNIFSKVLKYIGKDQHGDDQYQCLENEKLVINSSRRVDKVFTDILTNGVLKAMNKAIEESFESYDENVEDSVSTALAVNYDGIYGKPKNDAMTSIGKFRSIDADSKHIRNTVEKITNLTHIQ